MHNKPYLLQRIKDEGFKYTYDTLWLDPSGKQNIWAFDFKHLFLDRAFLNALTEEFWRIYGKDTPLQIGGMETASVPLISALVLAGNNATGFYIRKSKKKKNDLRQIEGTLTDAPIVLIDDVLNSGGSIERQINILKEYHRDVRYVFTCVRMRPSSYYGFFMNYGIELSSLFRSEDFGETYPAPLKDRVVLDAAWEYRGERPHEFNVSRRPQVALGSYLYLNADDGYVYAFEPNAGDIVWKYRIQLRIPAQHGQPGLIQGNDLLFVGSENGMIHALDALQGKRIWTTLQFDSILGNLSYEQKNDILIAGGRDGDKGSLIAMRGKSGEKLWEHRIDGGTSFHAISQKLLLAYVGSSTGKLTAVHLSSGRAAWSRDLTGPIFDAGTLYVDETDHRIKLATVTGDGRLYVLDAKNGKTLHMFLISHESGFSAAPAVEGSHAYLTTLHRTVYCVNLSNGSTEWEVDTRGRIFGKPVIHKDTLLFGNNEGVLYALDKRTGIQIGSYVGVDRIVTEPIVDRQTDMLYVSTISNRITALTITIS